VELRKDGARLEAFEHSGGRGASGRASRQAGKEFATARLLGPNQCRDSPFLVSDPALVIPVGVLMWMFFKLCLGTLCHDSLY
jgi:hypothetical protein